MGMFDCVNCHPSWQERFCCAKGHVLPNRRGWPDSWQAKCIPEGDCDGWVFDLDANGIFWRSYRYDAMGELQAAVDAQILDATIDADAVIIRRHAGMEPRVRSHMTVADFDMCDTCEVCRLAKDPYFVIVFLNVIDGQIEQWRVETV